MTDQPAGPRWVGAGELRAALPGATAVDALEAALRAGLDPEADPLRTGVSTGAGQLLLMPSTTGSQAGAKLVTVAPGNPAAGLPLVQGVYVLFSGATLTPVALLDGAALTALRTPAVSALAVRHLAAPGPVRLVLFGTGVQARGHAEVLAHVLDLAHVDVVGRTPTRVEALVGHLRASGRSAAPADPTAVAGADVVVCATSAREPLFDGALLQRHALVVAIGAHTPDAREVDTTTARRATVVVESRASALREAGDVVIPLAEGAIAEADLVALADVVTGAARVDPARPRLFTGTGMAWQDLVVAAAALARLS